MNLLDAEEGIAEQLLANRSRNCDGGIVVYAPPQFLDDMGVIGLNMESKLEIGAGVFVSTVYFGFNW